MPVDEKATPVTAAGPTAALYAGRQTTTEPSETDRTTLLPSAQPEAIRRLSAEKASALILPK